MKNIDLIFLMVFFAFSFGCDEELTLNKIEEKVPVIESFEPLTGTAGDEITIYGENLGNVKTAYVGDSLVTIKYRVNSNELVVKIDKGTVSGLITVENQIGSATSTEEFNVVHRVPVISDFEDSKVLPNSQFKIEGENLDVVYDVYVASSKATILEVNESFIQIEVPFFDEEEEPANVFFTYNDGGYMKQVGSAGLISLYRILPNFTMVPDQGITGSNIVFEGENLGLIDKMWFNDQEGAFTVNEAGDQLVVILTEEQFVVTTTGVTVRATYFGETQEEILHEDFEVIVPKVDFYSNITLHPRGGDDPFFLDFNTGVTYGACTPMEELQLKISVLAYASKSGYLQFRQAGNAGSVIKNYRCDETGEKLPDVDAVKVSQFAVLDESIPEQKEYIDAVKNKTLTEIDSDVVSEFGANTSDLKLYTDGIDSEDEFGPGDVIIVKQTWNDVVQYGFLEIIDTFVDVPEDCGQLEGDDSYITFNYYFQK
ncbi:IPT/TIG domain-containing protein [Anaerophaga thermohalophila]|uniref:IPT/TIG domain-containing protein n=1 Tax=Anaerophaga thermohalophila TaxID=177400 RepID=UPI000237B96B|nr:IPT/TIG domain-containing protein [Anaerophaga thermohalophila]